VAKDKTPPSTGMPLVIESTAKEIVPPTICLSLADTIAAMRELHRERQDYHNAEKRLTLQIKSIQRRVHARTCKMPKKHSKCEGVYDELPAAALVLSEQQGMINVHRKRPEKELQKLAKTLPVWPWIEAVRGVGALGFAQVVAEAGDLGAYNNPAKLWKRMGIGMYQRNDGIWERQRKAEGENGILAGYSPNRRSIVYVIGECIIKAGDGHYREIYDARKIIEADKPACGRAKCVGEHCIPGHIHNRAKRYMEKRLLRDLWREWRRVTSSSASPLEPPPPSSPEPDVQP